jgi:hypothetical protein
MVLNTKQDTNNGVEKRGDQEMRFPEAEISSETHRMRWMNVSSKGPEAGMSLAS